MFSTFESVSAGITFSSTTTFPGCVTAKYGSAVTIIPNVCMSLMAFTCPLPWFSTTSPKFTARPCGDTAHNTYVRYSSPNLVASSKPSNFASISIRLLLLSTFASPEAVCSSSVPWKLSLVDPPARRKFTAFVVRDTLEGVGAADATLWANVGPAATPQIPVTTRQIVAVFTSVLLFAHTRPQTCPAKSWPKVFRGFWGPCCDLTASSCAPFPKRKSRNHNYLRTFSLADLPKEKTANASPICTTNYRPNGRAERVIRPKKKCARAETLAHHKNQIREIVRRRSSQRVAS